MLKVILIDDEPKALTNLKWEIERCCEDVDVLQTFESAIAARDFLLQHPVDCIFLDIEMPEMNGFRFLEFFPDRVFSVIVTTAYNHYALEAIKKMAIDYLLKPIAESELKQSIEKARLIKRDRVILQTKNESPKSTTSEQRKIAIPFEGKIIFTDPSTISHCESDGNYCYVYLNNGNKLFLTQKLKFMEEKLAGFRFFRIHNSYLINLSNVVEYNRNGEYVVLQNNAQLPVSRNRKALFLEQF